MAKKIISKYELSFRRKENDPKMISEASNKTVRTNRSTYKSSLKQRYVPLFQYNALKV